ncbi:hypothetical protein A3B45_03615 [Candidatus Daviesbacteria bacterium RIFCSPLOWO2_01_FULL_39_12]|uniref:Uncharacterized protein n=1 Tax=Candidatus Daviesbacteria bacterium RIFCSPLOWO2_01_FULL_39_12 TaxID=1797785 RepID=A0A1F5KUP4_9BACT|nr:MAG: hypothetical protein A3B45_03615 [Candidatus Daviesbacteria bacterium RIFCSPLOWO2_01_FULL_39_12]
MSREALFDAEVATKKWQKKIDSGSSVNLFRLTADILQIHHGSDWQASEPLDLCYDDSTTISLGYNPKTQRGFDEIVMGVEYEDGKVEQFHFRHYVSTKGKNRFAVWVWDPSRYFRISGGTKLIDEQLRRINPSDEDLQEIAFRVWVAHQNTLDLKYQQQLLLLHPLSLGGLPSNIRN